MEDELYKDTVLYESCDEKTMTNNLIVVTCILMTHMVDHGSEPHRAIFSNAGKHVTPFWSHFINRKSFD